VFLSTQDSVEFHHLLLSDSLRTNTADAATEAQLQIFKLHGDLPQKVNLLHVLFQLTSCRLILCIQIFTVFIQIFTVLRIITHAFCILLRIILSFFAVYRSQKTAHALCDFYVSLLCMCLSVCFMYARYFTIFMLPLREINR